MVWFWYVANAYRYKDVKHAQKRYVGGTSLKPPRGPVPPWARAREVTIPAGHRRTVRAPLLLRQSAPCSVPLACNAQVASCHWNRLG